ncbi:terminase gpA endonuclease subunit [Thalassoroseus pseudoceratinae]|uniref:terminase gpA endonuclease subunit n=1 Tax=Thalassoroseus pseudoceratinae TaxID=2713176 RepID=UPI0014210816|nr:terminase gpA endonuclease subunit [Thalassoroseus pseudoceratinae]
MEANWRSVFTPPEKLTVAEWAELKLTLSERETATPGPLRFSRTPYLTEVVNSIADPNTEQITLCWAAQCAKTIGLFVMMAYGIDVDPGQILCVYPNSDLAKSVSRNRIQPLIDDCRTLARHKPNDRDKFSLLEMYLSRCTLRLTGANSPANLASRPIRYLYADEIDKFPAASDKEAGALDLAIERTKTFWNRKIVCTSTPTLDTGNIWRRFLEGDQRYFFVPCPHCSKKAGTTAGFQKLNFENLKFDSSLKHDDGSYDLDAIRDSVYYECQFCKGRILDKHKRKMLQLGEWRATATGNRHRSYHLSALYPSWIRFADVAIKFLESKDYPDSLRNFRNSWLGLPWLREIHATDDSEVFAHRSDYKLRTCPVEPIAVVLTADVQQDSLWYVVRAWLPGETSYLLDYGQVPNTDALLNVVGSVFDGPNGEPIRITHALIDSGFDTKEVYNFCRSNRFIPVKGRSGTQQTTPVKWYPIKGEHLNLMMISVDVFKQALQDKLGKPLGSPGAWHLPEDVCGIYASQLTSEVLAKKKDSKGFDVYYWEKVREDNHLLDCEVYQLALAYDLRLRQQRPTAPNEVKPKPKPQESSSSVNPFVRRDGRSFFDFGRI